MKDNFDDVEVPDDIFSQEQQAASVASQKSLLGKEEPKQVILVKSQTSSVADKIQSQGSH